MPSTPMLGMMPGRALLQGGTMDIEILKKADICFGYCRYAVFPQIPYVQDVLYIL